MTILPSPPKEWKRPSMPKGVKLAAWERKYGPVEYDHRPPVSERQFDTEAGDTIPPANDPGWIEPITKEAHDIRTNGIGGERRITTAGSDAGNRAKSRGIRATDLEHKLRMATKWITPDARKEEIMSRPRKTIQSRGFDKTKTRTFKGPVRALKART